MKILADSGKNEQWTLLSLSRSPLCHRDLSVCIKEERVRAWRWRLTHTESICNCKGGGGVYFLND